MYFKSPETANVVHPQLTTTNVDNQTWPFFYNDPMGRLAIQEINFYRLKPPW